MENYRYYLPLPFPLLEPKEQQHEEIEEEEELEEEIEDIFFEGLAQSLLGFSLAKQPDLWYLYTNTSSPSSISSSPPPTSFSSSPFSSSPASFDLFLLLKKLEKLQ